MSINTDGKILLHRYAIHSGVAKTTSMMRCTSLPRPPRYTVLVVTKFSTTPTGVLHRSLVHVGIILSMHPCTTRMSGYRRILGRIMRIRSRVWGRRRRGWNCGVRSGRRWTSDPTIASQGQLLMVLRMLCRHRGLLRHHHTLLHRERDGIELRMRSQILPVSNGRCSRLSLRLRLVNGRTRCGHILTKPLRGVYGNEDSTRFPLNVSRRSHRGRRELHTRRGIEPGNKRNNVLKRVLPYG